MMMDLVGDGGVVKTIKKEGNGEKASFGKYVEVHYVGTLVDGTKFDSSRDRNETFFFNLGSGEVIQGWDIAVSSMKIGEISNFVIQSKYGYGDYSAGSIPPKSILNFEIELISINEQSSWCNLI